VTDPAALGQARALRLVCWTQEAALLLIVAGSALAFGSVHPFAYRPLWTACAFAGGLVLVRAGLAHALRAYLGRRAFAFAGNGRSLRSEPGRDAGWSFDLARPLLPRGPLLLPGLAFLAWSALQLAPWPGRGAWSVAPDATVRGLAFVASLLALHTAAAATLGDGDARRRMRRALAWFGGVLALGALAQLSTGTRAIYGLFTPQEGGTPAGPFVNRNHLAGYLLLLAPMALGYLARALWAWRERAGGRGGTRRVLALHTPEGTALVYACLPALAAIAALLATTSRGAILAFVLSLATALLARRPRGRGAMLAMAVAFLAMGLTWFGLERLGDRFSAIPDNAPGRTRVWSDALARMDGRWLTGAGLNAFEAHLSRVPAWRLPEGATPWPDEAREPFESGARVGFRFQGSDWYREAHNDYLQVLVESGVPGLLIALWAAAAALHRNAPSRWVFAALLGMLLHALVEFDFQIPALPALFVVLAAWRRSGAMLRA
jgi:O-antigen ligase